MPSGPGLRRRELLALAPQEWFRVPAFSSSGSLKDRLILGVRHLVDPGAASIWQDLSILLAQLQGDFLDVGCGAQPYRRLLGPGARYRGIDRAESKDVFGYSFPDTTYYSGDRWPVEDASMDWVLATEVLEHVEDPAQFLAEALRCLRPGGRLILTVPFCARVHYLPHDYRRFTQFGLRSEAQQAGFEAVQVWARGNPLSVLCSKVLGVVLPLLQVRGGWRLPAMFLGLLLAPLGAAAGCLAFLTLNWGWGDDYIGYTALAKKPG